VWSNIIFAFFFFSAPPASPVCDLRVFILAADGAIFSLHKASQADGGLFVHFFVWSLHKNVLFVTRILAVAETVRDQKQNISGRMNQMFACLHPPWSVLHYIYYYVLDSFLLSLDEQKGKNIIIIFPNCVHYDYLRFYF
jgi:hypothetical protein